MTKQNNDYTLSKTDYDKTGYWGVTKQLVDKTYVDLNKDKPGTTNTSSAVLLFTGHSQGGTRAALASMYMKKKYGGRSVLQCVFLWQIEHLTTAQQLGS
jgi:hypothetical protein